MANLDISAVYQFIARQCGTDWQQDLKKYYGDEEVLEIGDLHNFFNAHKSEWNGEQTLTNDLVNQFWRSLDTDNQGDGLNILSNDEIKAAEARMKFSIEIEKALKDLPSIDDKWKAFIAEDLASKYEEVNLNASNMADEVHDLIKENLSVIIEDAIEACIAKTIKGYKSIIANLVGTNSSYKLENDAVLHNFIMNFLVDDRSISSVAYLKSTIEGLEKKVENLISEYVALTSSNLGKFVGEAEKYNDAYNQALNGLKMNPLQRAVVYDRCVDILKILGLSTNDLKKYEDIISENINEYLKYNSDKGYNDLLTEFENSPQYTYIKNYTTIKSQYAEIKEGSVIYSALKDVFGEDFAKNMLKGDSSKVYQEIIEEALKLFSANEKALDYKRGSSPLELNDVINYIIQQIMERSAEDGFDFFSPDASKTTPEEKQTEAQRLNGVWDKLETIATNNGYQGITFSNSEAFLKNASKEYCDALVKLGYKGDDILKAMAVVGPYQSYTDAIDNLEIDTLKSAINKVKDFVKTHKPVQTTTGGNPEVPEDGDDNEEAKELPVDSNILKIESFITEHNGYEANLEEAKEQAKNLLEDKLEGIRKRLIAQGYKESLVNNTIDSVKSYYIAFINAIYDSTGGTNIERSLTVEGSYTNEYNTSESFTASYRQKTKNKKADANGLEDRDENYAITLLEHHNRSSNENNHFFMIAIDGDVLADRILNTYNKLVKENNADNGTEKDVKTESIINQLSTPFTLDESSYKCHYQGTDGIGEALNNSTFAELYNADAMIELLQISQGSWKGDYDDHINNAVANLTTLFDDIEKMLANTGAFDENILADVCADVLKEYSSNVIEVNNDKRREKCAKAALSEIYENDGYRKGLVQAFGDGGTWETKIFFVSFKTIVDTIIERYNKLV